jgi:hypothetical protein
VGIYPLYASKLLAIWEAAPKEVIEALLNPPDPYSEEVLGAWSERDLLPNLPQPAGAVAAPSVQVPQLDVRTMALLDEGVLEIKKRMLKVQLEIVKRRRARTLEERAKKNRNLNALMNVLRITRERVRAMKREARERG